MWTGVECGCMLCMFIGWTSVWQLREKESLPCFSPPTQCGKRDVKRNKAMVILLTMGVDAHYDVSIWHIASHYLRRSCCLRILCAASMSKWYRMWSMQLMCNCYKRYVSRQQIVECAVRSILWSTGACMCNYSYTIMATACRNSHYSWLHDGSTDPIIWFVNISPSTIGGISKGDKRMTVSVWDHAYTAFLDKSLIITLSWNSCSCQNQVSISVHQEYASSGCRGVTNRAHDQSHDSCSYDHERRTTHPWSNNSSKWNLARQVNR